MKRKLCTFLTGICICVSMLVHCEINVNAKESKVVATAEIVSGGDLLISDAVLAGAKTDSGNYNFDHIFKYVDDYIKDADYAVVNLETCIAGKSKGYCGFPRFNTPGSIVTAAKKAGFDMFLTASNHSYDWSYSGLINKINWLQEKNVDYIGTREETDEYFHKIVTVNGIKIGMLNYTRETGDSTKEKVILNSTRTGPNGTREYVVVGKKGQVRIASYNEKYIDEFYETMKTDIESLKVRGAEVIVAYPHWGTEYNIGYDAMEDKIAQKMCDLGVDVIVGGHPHVVEPVEVYTSKISGKTTVCIHSTGNFVSSMRRTQKDINPDYVEDGALFSFTVKKYDDGSAAVTAAEVLPLWVKKSSSKYIVIPLDKSVDWKKEFGVANTSEKKSSGYQSYIRTMDLVSDGIEKFNAMPKIYKQPESLNIKAKTTAEFSVKASGKDIRYQWQYSTDGGETWKKCSEQGSQSSSFAFTAWKKSNGRYFRCRVKTDAGTAYTETVMLTVK